MIRRKVNQERIARYRKAYPGDCRSDEDILKDLDEIKKEKRYIDRWINRQCYEGKLSEDELKK